jgi:aspartate oxidase
LSITIAAGSGAGIFTSTGSVAVVAGDLVCWKARNNATVTSVNLTQYSAIHT